MTRVEAGCTNLRQGDVVELDSIPVAHENGAAELVPTPAGVAIISQTCDIVQPGKERCIVAPVLQSPDKACLQGAKKGRKPLHLFIASREEGNSRVADMERSASIPKVRLIGQPILARAADGDSSEAARAVAWRIGRAFSRFPFPDEVYPAFNKLRESAQSKAGTPSPLGQVFDLVQELRVGADQWAAPGRRLTLYVLLPTELLESLDSQDPNWTWNTEHVYGLRRNETKSGLPLARTCELLLRNQNPQPADGPRNSTTVAQLWQLFGEKLTDQLLTPSLSDEVIAFEAEVLSDIEMTVRDYQSTESLDLEVLSDSRAS